LIGLLQNHYQPVLSFIDQKLPKSLRHILDPQDLLQDTYFNAFRLVSTLRSDDYDAFHRWLLTIARNQIVDAVRRHNAAKRGSKMVGQSPENWTEDSIAVLLEELAVHERTPSKSAIMHELMGTLTRSMESLPEAYQAALRLRYFEQLNVCEMAVRMNRTERAIHELCHRALKSLRLEMRSASHYL